MGKTWGGRFGQETHALVEELTASIHYDQNLYVWDILGSKAHARMLTACGVLTQPDLEAILRGLDEVQQEIEAGKLEFTNRLEDIHTHVEHRLIEKIGEPGRKLHTARSRNDQVATDFRLYLRNEVDQILALLHNFQCTLVALAEQHVDTLFPGYTHLQRAQPIVFGHHLLAYYEMLQRDSARFRECRQRINVLPLGVAALAGTSYPIDRQAVARELGFDQVAANSLDAVSDRDFAIEFSAHAAILMMHLSRLCEELILWSSIEFGFIELSDAFCTGSSIMPQKKNPDVAELIRGKTGRVYGHLMSLLTLMKSLPLTYNRDMQEDKEPVFDIAATLNISLRVFPEMLRNMKVNNVQIAQTLEGGFMTATEVADYLVRRGVSFRTAHGIVGELIRYSLGAGKTLQELSLEEYQRISEKFDEAVLDVVTPQQAVNCKTSVGGTAPHNVFRAIQAAKDQLGIH
ncbi:argininosuccinate lyase [Candidatus Vecturithrix granuli]|uniref:Argininosuccinate lyase n=1 Tax=Vecturithrix granuli TaxID=1499967 RepID=A0A081C2Q9_VECG1|nr:argininosuccinate lyase [Candidatus Vecturithrix granuli]